MVDTDRPDTDRPDTDRGSGSSSGQPRRPRCPVPQPPRQRPRCPAARPAAAGPRRSRSRRSGITAAPRKLRLLVCAGQVGKVAAAGGYRLSGRADTGGGLPDTGSLPAPALRTPATGQGRADAAAAATLDSRQQRRPPPQPCPTGTGPQCAAPPARPPDRQIRRLAVSVWWIVASAVRAGQLGCSVWSVTRCFVWCWLVADIGTDTSRDRPGSCRVVGPVPSACHNPPRAVAVRLRRPSGRRPRRPSAGRARRGRSSRPRSASPARRGRR
jgi:hypothetical protein